jgi:8-oxo-dGTP pyrophosphatase MutT (NUDIX family)
MAAAPDLVGRLRDRLRTGDQAPAAEDLRAGGSWMPDTAEGAAPTVPAAVLVPIVEAPDGPFLVLTRRAGHLRKHRGEISFPGGRVDAGESDLEAALREAHEELGIDPGEVDVLGHLPRVPTVVSGYLIAPWVGVIPQSAFVPNPREIAEVLEVPFGLLLEPGARRDQRFIRKGMMQRSPAFDVGAHVVWGATARILAGLLDLVAGPRGGSVPPS